MRFESLEDYEVVADLRAEDYFLRLNAPIAFIQKHNLFQAGL